MKTSYEDYRLTGIVLVVSLVTVFLVVNAVESNASTFMGTSTIFWSALIIFGIQWVAWIPASLLQSERFYDLTGGITYIAVIIFSLWAGLQSEKIGTREYLVSLLVFIWSIRLSTFLFMRIHKKGKDGRFDNLKTSPVRFLVPWTLQGLWIFLTAIVVIVINCQSGTPPPIGVWDIVGFVIWILGFSIEIVADLQKTNFNSKSENQGMWIDKGLWSYCRHPNYLGEIMLWSGIAIIGLSCLSGFELVSFISPVFIYLLLTKVSGIPILDRRALEKWGEMKEYQEYRNRVPELIPKLIFK